MSRKNIKNIIKEYFFVYPTAKLRVREMERLLQLPLPSVIKYCRELEKEDILSTHKIGTVNFYTASQSHDFILEKKLYNLKQLYTSGLIEYVRQELSNPAIVLFGSYAKGEDTPQSDIDLYIETPSKKSININSYEQKLKRKIQLFQHKSIKDVKNVHLANNIINGIVVHKHIEVFK